MDLIFSEDMIPYDDDKGDLRYRFFRKGHLDFVHNMIENSPAEQTLMYFHARHNVFALMLYSGLLRTKDETV